MPSRLFLYWCERDMEGSTGQDAGAMIRDGMKCLAATGICPESEWEYTSENLYARPPDSCYTDALKYQALTYQRVDQDLDQMKGCLVEGLPFALGISVYSSFESREVAQNGVVPLPGRWERQLGGHAVLAVGYNDADQRFIVRNSWGKDWGQNGYFTIPYAYLTNSNLSDDFWVVQTVEA